jgi:nucleoid-associated protein YgaU
MSRRSLPIFLAIMALTAMSVSVWAKNDSGDTITANVKLMATTTVGTTKLAPGEYKVIADGSKAKFEQGNKVVAEVPCTLKDFGGKINQTTFVVDNNQLTEIQVSGKSTAIEFSAGK